MVIGAKSMDGYRTSETRPLQVKHLSVASQAFVDRRRGRDRVSLPHPHP